jgi:hypothetical protein
MASDGKSLNRKPSAPPPPFIVALEETPPLNRILSSPLPPFTVWKLAVASAPLKIKKSSFSLAKIF